MAEFTFNPDFVPEFDDVTVSDGVRSFRALPADFASEQCAEDLAFMFGAVAIDQRPYLSGNIGNVKVSALQRFLVFHDPASGKLFRVVAGRLANYYFRNPISRNVNGARDWSLAHIEAQRKLQVG